MIATGTGEPPIPSILLGFVAFAVMVYILYVLHNMCQFKDKVQEIVRRADERAEQQRIRVVQIIGPYDWEREERLERLIGPSWKDEEA